MASRVRKKAKSARKKKKAPERARRLIAVFCNRCNSQKQGNARCVACGSPEFRIEER